VLRFLLGLIGGVALRAAYELARERQLPPPPTSRAREIEAALQALAREVRSLRSELRALQGENSPPSAATVEER
jgi:hypothetical protein